MNNEERLRKQTLIAFYLIISIFSLLFFKEYALDWPAAADIPNVLAKIYPEILNNDFYVQSTQNSPMKYYYKLLYYVSSLFFNNVYYTLIALGLFVLITVVPIIFSLLILSNFNSVIFNNDYKYNYVLFLLSNLLYFIFLWYLASNKPGLLGWSPMGVFPHGWVVATALSIISYIIYHTKYILISLILAVLAVFVHPIAAIYSFAFSFLVSSDFSSPVLFIKKYILLFIFILLPLISIALTVFDAPKISSKEYIDIFINYRHPFHFLISSKNFNAFHFLSGMSVLLLSSFVLYRFKSKLFLNSLLASLILFLIPIIQYLSTEVLYIKSIAMLQLPRFFYFFHYIVGFFVIAAFSIICHWIIVSFEYKKISLLTFVHIFFDYICNKFYLRKLFLYFNITFLCILFFLSIRYVGRQNYILTKQVTDFKDDYSIVLKHVDKNDVLLPLAGKGFDIMHLGGKNIFITYAFPFTEINFPEFKERLDFLLSCQASFTDECADKILNKYNIDYILVDNNFNYVDKRFTVIDSSKKFKLIKVNK